MTTATQGPSIGVSEPGVALPVDSTGTAAHVPLPRRTVVWFGIGQAAEGIKSHSFTAFLLFYYTSVLGLGGTLAGAALMIALVFDAVSDPAIAVVSDRTHSRWGRRHPFMLVSAVPLGVFFYLTFDPPHDLAAILHISEQWALFLWLVTFTVLTRAAMTLYHVPHMALGAELSQDFDERTRVVFSRSVFSVVGAAGAIVGYFVLLGVFETPEGGDPRLLHGPYRIYALGAGVAMTVLILASAWFTRDRIPHLVEPDEQSRGEGFLASLVRDPVEALRIGSFRSLFIGFTLCFVGFGATTALGQHNAVYFWHISVEQQGTMALAMGVGIAIGMPYWKRVADRTDKKSAFLRGLGWFVVFAALPPLAKVVGLFPMESSVVYFPAILVSHTLFTFGIASALVLVGSMMADITDEDELRFGRKREGIFFGALSFASKAASGLGMVTAGLVYDLVGLRLGMSAESAPEGVVRNLGLVNGGLILVLVGASFAIFRRYGLTRERHAEIRAELDARAAGSRPVV